ncbi:MAG: hypothetical protein BWY21_00256 [Parcubacteria group bacterium ADurb.Bin216]|nr:MAG: hypothetical protein BWY21_00256 [Parcubacteria group bacterium ADurb.Bin216]
MVANVLAPYDENIEVPRYVRMNLEVSEKKRLHEIEHIKEILASGDAETYNIPYCKTELERLTNIKPEDYLAERLKHYEDEDLNADKTEGYSTYNPNSKWDWYSIGGRWDEKLVTKDGEQCNECPIPDIDLEKSQKPYAIVSKKQGWIAPGDMGWWGMSSETEAENKSFKERIPELLANENPDMIIFNVDCHI